MTLVCCTLCQGPDLPIPLPQLLPTGVEVEVCTPLEAAAAPRIAAARRYDSA